MPTHGDPCPLGRCRIIRTYLIDGQEVTVTWKPREHPAVYTIDVVGTPAPGSVEKTAAGKFLVLDDHHRPLGTCIGLRAAVERLVRGESH